MAPDEDSAALLDFAAISTHASAVENKNRLVLRYSDAILGYATAILGDRHACLAREVTKIHEEFRRGRLTELFQSLEAQPAKGEITLVIGPAEKDAPGAQAHTAQSLAARVDELMHQAKLDRKDALKLAAKERGITKRDAYRQLLDENPESD